jgi:hypothetical protein
VAPAELELPGAWPRPMEGLDVVKGTGARRQPLDALEWLGSYSPAGLDPVVCDGVRRFVWECVCHLGWNRDSASAWRVLRELARIASWAVAEWLPLDVEVVLDPDTVERFIVVGLAGDPSRSTYRAVLRRVGPRLTKRAPWQPRPATVARRQVAPPYSPQELGVLMDDAVSQPTSNRVRAARALLALGAGAGLDGRWVARVTAGDVSREGRVVLVSVGEPAARQVPVLADWEDEVVDLANTAGGEFLVGGRSTSKNRAGAIAAWLVVGHGHPRFSASRLRSTWLVTHLAMGTRLPELARAAGLHGATVLSDLMPFVPALDETAASQMLRGRS